MNLLRPVCGLVVLLTAVLGLAGCQRPAATNASLGQYMNEVGTVPHPRPGYLDKPGDVLLPSQLDNTDPTFACATVFTADLAVIDRTQKRDWHFHSRDSIEIKEFSAYMGVAATAEWDRVTECDIYITDLQAPSVRHNDLARATLTKGFADRRKSQRSPLDRSTLVVLDRVTQADSITFAFLDSSGERVTLLAPAVVNTITLDAREVNDDKYTIKGSTLGSRPVIRFGGSDTPFTRGDAERLRHKFAIFSPLEEEQLTCEGNTLVIPSSWETAKTDLGFLKDALGELKREIAADKALVVAEQAKMKAELAKPKITQKAKKVAETRLRTLAAQLDSAQQRIAALP